MGGHGFWGSWKGLALLVVAALAFSYGLRLSGPKLVDVGGNAALPAILADIASPSDGPADAKVTLAVYTDYRCPVCRSDAKALERLARRERGLRVIYKDWPILGPDSVTAARAALAAAYQGKYGPMHRALMAAPRLDEAGIASAMMDAGVDADRLHADLVAHGPAIDALLAAHGREALALGLPGTPGYLANRFLAVGAMGNRGFSRLISEARGAL